MNWCITNCKQNHLKLNGNKLKFLDYGVEKDACFSFIHSAKDEGKAVNNLNGLKMVRTWSCFQKIFSVIAHLCTASHTHELKEALLIKVFPQTCKRVWCRLFNYLLILPFSFPGQTVFKTSFFDWGSAPNCFTGARDRGEGFETLLLS